MHIVVSNDKRVPIDLQGGDIIEQWTPQEFFDKASSDDGLEIDEDLWYDASYLTKEIFDDLESYVEYGVKIVYYRFDDMPLPNFNITREVITYSTKEPEPEPEPEIEPEPEPIKDNIEEDIFNKMSSKIEEVTPVVEKQPEPEPEPQIQQPEPQPIPQAVQTPIQQPIQQYQQQAQPQYQQPVQQYQPPQYQPQAPQYAPQYQQPVQQYQQPNYYEPQIEQPKFEEPKYEPPKQESDSKEKKSNKSSKSNDSKNEKLDNALSGNVNNMLLYDDYDSAGPGRKKSAPAKVILFGSSKGGSGKTFTCLISAYWYAKSHPTEKVALADFDIIDGQVGITINKLTPTMQDYYKLNHNGRKEFTYLDNCKVKSDNFTPNIDFYLAPSQDIPQITNDFDFWKELFELLITNYDVVFFDSGIDYLGKAPISMLYKIADKIIITSNPSINSVKSVIKQFKTLSGQRPNNVFKRGDEILSKVNVVLTRVMDSNKEINQIVEANIGKFAPVVAKFGNIDDIISQVQWYQRWHLIDKDPNITKALDKITKV